MKNLITILSMMLFHSTMSNGNVPTEFVLNTDTFYRFHARNNVICAVNLDNKTSRFEIIFDIRFSEDPIYELAIFLGIFTRSGQYLSFKDIQTGVTMTAKAEGNSLVFIKSPAFLKNREWGMVVRKPENSQWGRDIMFDEASAKKKRAELYDSSDNDKVMLYRSYYYI